MERKCVLNMEKKQEKYYSCNYLCSLKDVNGNIPEIYISDGNRTAGKSYSWKSKILNKYFKGLKEGLEIRNFMLLYRNKYEIAGCENSFFEDVGRDLFSGHEMSSKKVAEGVCNALFMDGDLCGYAVPLSMAGKVKKLSALFNTIDSMFFDEYQDDYNKYLADEVEKLFSIHTTVARGFKKQVRRVPLYMASNTISILNPYYSALGITKQLRKETKFIRGDGWVYERTFNKNASERFQSSAFNQAFKNSKYFLHASENVYLNDNENLVEKPSGFSNYQMSVKYNNEWYSIRRYDDFMYVDEGCDSSYPVRICFNVDDVTDNRQIMIGSSHYMVIMLRDWFSKGSMRFKNIRCKNMIFDLLAYI